MTAPIMPRDDVEQLLEYGVLGEENIYGYAEALARSLLAAHDEIDRLRADAGAAVALAVEQAVESVRDVWGRCEALEDEAADKLARSDELADHERGFWRGQKSVAKSIRRSTEIPLAATDRLAATNARLEAQVAALTGALDAIAGYNDMPCVEWRAKYPDLTAKFDVSRKAKLGAGHALAVYARAALEAATIAAMPPEERAPADKQEDRG